MKYVAFLDILGFKDRLKSMSQVEAKKYIEDFSNIILNVFSGSDERIEGIVVSDSIILSTLDASKESLLILIDTIDKICKSEFRELGILMRGGIAKGEFDNMNVSELPQLKNQLIVGEAYVEAYLLEDTVKTIGISISKSVYIDLKKLNKDSIIVDEKINNTDIFLFNYISVEFLLEKDNLYQFIKLAIESDWLPHYYNTIYFAIKNKSEQSNILFPIIYNQIREIKVGKEYSRLNKYIMNTFNDDVMYYYKQIFSKHLRQGLHNIFVECDSQKQKNTETNYEKSR